MKLKDLAFIGAVVLLLAPFFLSNDLYAAYLACNASHPYLMALLKFGILSTAGEVIGLRIKTGRYNEPGFGILPHAVVWGFLGVWIAAMMKTLSIGVPAVAESFGIEGVAAAMKGELTPLKFIGALLISLTMNTTFAPRIHDPAQDHRHAHPEQRRFAAGSRPPDSHAADHLVAQLGGAVGIRIQEDNPVLLDSRPHDHLPARPPIPGAVRGVARGDARHPALGGSRRRPQIGLPALCEPQRGKNLLAKKTACPLLRGDKTKCMEGE